MSKDPSRPIRVGIGLIGREGSYLIRQRLLGQAMAGYWEFPGGKCEAGESALEATARECREEVGIQVVVGRLAHRFEYRYPHGLIDLHYFHCQLEEPDAQVDPKSGFVWVSVDELPGYRFPDANDVVIARLILESKRLRGGSGGER